MGNIWTLTLNLAVMYDFRDACGYDLPNRSAWAICWRCCTCTRTMEPTRSREAVAAGDGPCWRRG